MLPTGWTESHKDGIATNRDPDFGGIVDKNLVSGLWFIIPNSDHLNHLMGREFSSRDKAFNALATAIDETFWIS